MPSEPVSNPHDYCCQTCYSKLLAIDKQCQDIARDVAFIVEVVKSEDVDLLDDSSDDENSYPPGKSPKSLSDVNRCLMKSG